jgi:hypothetical protein
VSTLTAPTTAWRTAVLTALAMLAFAANSLLTRMALQGTHIDPASFGSVRLASGALVLAAIVHWRATPRAAARQADAEHRQLHRAEQDQRAAGHRADGHGRRRLGRVLAARPRRG